MSNPTVSEQVAADIVEASDIGSTPPWEDESEEQSQIAAQLEELGFLEAPDEMDYHEYVEAMLRDFGERFRSMPYICIHLLGKFTWGIGAQAEWIEENRLVTLLNWKKDLQKITNDAEIDLLKKQRCINQLTECREEIAMLKRCAERAAIVHDEMGMMLDSDIELSDRPFKFKWTPRTEEMKGARLDTVGREAAINDELANA
jgi:hypothetical protein